MHCFPELQLCLEFAAAAIASQGQHRRGRGPGANCEPTAELHLCAFHSDNMKGCCTKNPEIKKFL